MGGTERTSWVNRDWIDIDFGIGIGIGSGIGIGFVFDMLCFLRRHMNCQYHYRPRL